MDQQQQQQQQYFKQLRDLYMRIIQQPDMRNKWIPVSKLPQLNTFKISNASLFCSALSRKYFANQQYFQYNPTRQAVKINYPFVSVCSFFQLLDYFDVNRTGVLHNEELLLAYIGINADLQLLEDHQWISPLKKRFSAQGKILKMYLVNTLNFIPPQCLLEKFNHTSNTTATDPVQSSQVLLPDINSLNTFLRETVKQTPVIQIATLIPECFQFSCNPSFFMLNTKNSTAEQDLAGTVQKLKNLKIAVRKSQIDSVVNQTVLDDNPDLQKMFREAAQKYAIL